MFSCCNVFCALSRDDIARISREHGLNVLNEFNMHECVVAVAGWFVWVASLTLDDQHQLVKTLLLISLGSQRKNTFFP